ncbi:hypothetical protein ACJJI4_10750 [Microbulbifer sp. TRSA002]|uniref:hypothetical protein n=1 Tax=Microbulbifer sp. TRSA002 TaxID=3243382 RepID=UPI0040396EFE
MVISWFVRCLNKFIARQPVRKTTPQAAFWGRFKSQALLDGRALTACMVYVDLNPTRAKMAKLPEDSSHTSIQQRIHTINSGE